MIRRFGIMGFALVVVLAFTGLAASSALAEEKTKILPEPTAEKPLTATAVQKEEGHFLTVGGLHVICKKALGSESWTSANLGTGAILFTECTGPLSTVCTGTGDPEGLIAAKGVVHFWLALNMFGPQTEPKSELVGALVFLLEETGVPFTCVNKAKTIEDKIVVKGCLAGQVLPTSLNTLISKAHEVFEEWLSGETSILSVLKQEATSEIPCLPTATTNGGTAELAALDALFFFEEYKKAGAAITIELMNP